ncbi:MAG: CocE/NonD family hydrolase [Flavobacteriales bacterium]|nr:CocE/NonD family hydrolase [Flavobacteriales bacterium]
MRTPLLAIILSALFILPVAAGSGKGGNQTLGTVKYSPEPAYKGFSYYSQYVPMTDSVRLAVDVFLPKKLEEGKKVPTIVYFVRYVRTFQLKAFWRGIKDPAFGSVAEEEVKFFTSHGYAVAIVDLRGTGASFGHRDMEFSPQEVKDMGEMLDWIVKEPWSDGKTATTGISYTGTTAELALITRHPSLKACVPRSNIFDLYTDIVYPGGIRQSPFVKVWKLTTNSLDFNTLAPLGKKVETFVKWPSPVDGDKKGILLQQAMAEHKANYDIFDGLYRINSRNEPDKGYGAELTADDCSIHARKEDIEASGVPIFRIGGWFDGALPNSVFKGLWNTKNTKRVMVGPWDHGPGQQFSNFTGNKEKDINIELEILRFLDHHVKGIDTGLDNEPPVNFYTMGSEKWQATDVWPPATVQPQEWFFGNGTLTSTSAKPDTINYACNYTTTTGYGEKGGGTRWNSLTVLYKYEDTFYGPRNRQDSLMVVFDSPALTEDTEITGHPEVTLNVSTTTGHGHLFVYLEEVLPDGTSRYITEGQLDITHLKVCVKGDYECRFPQQSFKLEDRQPLQPGEFRPALVNLIPTSYLVKKGNRVRIAVGTADVDHFDIPEKSIRPNELRILVGEGSGSLAKLPVNGLKNL